MGIFQLAISHHRNAGKFTSENKYMIDYRVTSGYELKIHKANLRYGHKL